MYIESENLGDTLQHFRLLHVTVLYQIISVYRTAENVSFLPVILQSVIALQPCVVCVRVRDDRFAIEADCLPKHHLAYAFIICQMRLPKV